MSANGTSAGVIDVELVVTGRQQRAAGVVQLSLSRPDGSALPPWSPGAHIDLVIEDPDSAQVLDRQYSLCGPTSDSSTWTVAVLRAADSRGGSTLIHDQVDIGSRVRVRGPRNHFPFDAAQRYIFIAGGIGITPILAMVRQAESAGADWRLWYGGRSRESMAFVDELGEYGDRVRVLPQDENGLLPLADVLSDAQDDTLVYCCGPEPLLAAAEDVCSSWPAGALRLERFTPRGTTAHDPEASFVVECAQSGLELTVEPGETILEVLVDNGIDVDTSCTEGVCGTCETRVLGGVPDHLDSILSAEEREQNDTMFVCVSRSRTPRLVIDL